VREVEVIDDTHYRVTARVGIGAIAANFRVDAELTEAVDGERASVRGTAQAPGTSVEGVGSMTLVDDGGGTRMEWQVTVRISGKLAAVGERLIRSTADRLVEQAFRCVRSKLEESAAQPSP
jgi:carbon monoxide dehydrogenase subunit G